MQRDEQLAELAGLFIGVISSKDKAELALAWHEAQLRQAVAADRERLAQAIEALEHEVKSELVEAKGQASPEELENMRGEISAFFTARCLIREGGGPDA